MSATSALLVMATVLAVEGATATIDAGATQRLQMGDSGTVFYELTVNGTTRRIEVGPVTVVAVEVETATIESRSGAKLRPGHSLELRLPIDRQAPFLERLASVPAEPAPSDPVPPTESEPLAPPDAHPPEPELGKTVPDDYPEQTLPAVPVEPELSSMPSAPPTTVARDSLHVPAGHYLVGLDSTAAAFFNQTPQHEVFLGSFSIDRTPVGVTGLTFEEAKLHCEEIGLRLPSEAEWEVAAQLPGFVAEHGLYEWTASWYEAYPGNLRSEAAYGRSFRVLRRYDADAPETVHARRYMAPNQGNPEVDFRCVGDLD